MGQGGRMAIRLPGRSIKSMTRRNLIFLAPWALCAQSGWILSNAPGAGIGVGQSGPVPNKPLSGVETRRMTQVLGDGTHVDRSDTSNFYRDAAGRMRSESRRARKMRLPYPSP
jgi:hypothetical protein